MPPASEGFDAGGSGVLSAPPWVTALQQAVLEQQALEGIDLFPAVDSAANALNIAGFAPQRLSLSIITRHPGLSGLAYVYNAADGRVVFLERPPGFLEDKEHLESPLHHVMTTKKTLFIDEPGLTTDRRFPIIENFVKAGATSYVALPLHTARGDTHVLATWTARPGGWSRADVRQIELVIPLFTLLVEVTENRRLLGIIGTAHEVTQRALAEQALRSADELLKQQSIAMERLKAERDARFEAERLLAERNAELAALAVSLEAKVSERTRELEEALTRANAATMARSRFLAMMSHEIRTPMHGVLGLAELLSKTELDASQVRYVDTIQTTGRALLSLLNSILDFSKIEAGRVELERFAVDPARILEEVTALLGISARDRGIRLDVRVADDVPHHVEADPTRLRQVWVNLIGNAVKFTERGSVEASLEVASRAEGNCVLRGTVRDTGPGIGPEALERLFEPFTQADGSMARRFGGTGLGLTICKGLLEQMGGSLTVESTLDVGSTFSFTIPVATPAAAPPPAPAEAPHEPENVEGLRVLVVDDNPVNRLVAERQLRMIGVPTIAVASGGAEALDALASRTFDVVLMDVQMPGMDGLTCTRELRKMPLAVQPRVIAMTANAFEADRRACQEAGMDGFLAKPTGIAALKEALAGPPHEPRPEPRDEPRRDVARIEARLDVLGRAASGRVEHTYVNGAVHPGAVTAAIGFRKHQTM
ncbi:hypothetical protein DFJ74DRAFT_773009 [Hyaloraphidium curvatum]|nr:hypothetical protein DFJ74DRAFT_773009 [Hyaloraphidium curvatum]